MTVNDLDLGVRLCERTVAPLIFETKRIQDLPSEFRNLPRNNAKGGGPIGKDRISEFIPIDEKALATFHSK